MKEGKKSKKVKEKMMFEEWKICDYEQRREREKREKVERKKTEIEDLAFWSA